MTYEIKLGKLTWLRYLGYILMILGGISFLVFIALWISGRQLPIEMFWIYYTFIVGDTMWSSGFISVILIIVGQKMAQFRLYKKAQLSFENSGGLIIICEKEQVELAKWQIGKIEIQKKWLTKLLNFRIKTTINTEYEIKTDRILYERMTKEFEYKLSIKNAV